MSDSIQNSFTTETYPFHRECRQSFVERESRIDDNSSIGLKRKKLTEGRAHDMFTSISFKNKKYRLKYINDQVI